MKIAVLGAGAVGAQLARCFAAAGHSTTLANSRDPQTIRELAGSFGAGAAWAGEAVRDADVVITSVPPTSLPAVREHLLGAGEGVPVIDTGNYHPFRDGKIDALERGQIEAIWTSDQLGRPVTKAWNCVLSQTLVEAGTPAGSAGRIALPIAGDDENAKQLAATLTDVTGFDPVDVGGVAESWRMHPGTGAYCTELPVTALRQALEHAEADHAPLRRDLAWQAFGTFHDLTRHDIVRFHRALTRTPDPA